MREGECDDPVLNWLNNPIGPDLTSMWSTHATRRKTSNTFSPSRLRMQNGDLRHVGFAYKLGDFPIKPLFFPFWALHHRALTESHQSSYSSKLSTASHLVFIEKYSKILSKAEVLFFSLKIFLFFFLVYVDDHSHQPY